MQVKTLQTVDDVRVLTDLLRDYVIFVATDLERAFGVAFEPEVLLAKAVCV